MRAEPGLSNSLLHPSPRTEPVYNEPVSKACLQGAFIEFIHSFEFLGVSPPLMFLLVRENGGR